MGLLLHEAIGLSFEGKVDERFEDFNEVDFSEKILFLNPFLSAFV